MDAPSPLPDGLDSRDLLNHLPVALALLDGNENVLYTNACFRAWFGTPHTLRSWWRTLLPDSPSTEPPALNGAIRAFTGPQARHLQGQRSVHGPWQVLCCTERDGGMGQQAILQQALVELETSATTDPLTGVLTRRRLEEASANELQRFRRFGHPIALILADIDHFKQVNDGHGHLVGDRVLAEFARRLETESRDLDVVGRYGGEEFVILLPSTTLPGACVLAEKLRRAVWETPFPQVGPLSASFGVAECQPGEDWHQWLGRADKALYAAKSQGRNRVEAAPGSTPTSTPIPMDARLNRLVWEEGHCVGDPVLDEQHRTLFGLAHELLQLIRAQAPMGQLYSVLDHLIQTIGQHFHDEERVMTQLNYPGLAQHIKAHRILGAKLDGLTRQSAQGSLSPARLLDFLAYDLVDHHALGPDRDFIPWLQDSGAANPYDPTP
ncbi:MAG: diguanylate cyclase [Rhodocyclales bacterium]|nr:diguanylate cyclase [Rhodocyclales bacterium]